VAGAEVVVTRGVDGAPDVVAGDRGVGRQLVAGGGRVGAVAVDRDRLRVHGGSAVLQGEGDGALRVEAAREHRRVFQDRVRSVAGQRQGAVGAGRRYQGRGRDVAEGDPDRIIPGGTNRLRGAAGATGAAAELRVKRNAGQRPPARHVLHDRGQGGGEVRGLQG